MVADFARRERALAIHSERVGHHELGSISILTAEPGALGQAPCGELNEKMRGSSSGSETPCSGHAKRSE